MNEAEAEWVQLIHTRQRNFKRMLVLAVGETVVGVVLLIFGAGLFGLVVLGIGLLMAAGALFFHALTRRAVRKVDAARTSSN